MTIEEFRATLAKRRAPEGISPALHAMWEDAHGHWDAARKVTSPMPPIGIDVPVSRSRKIPLLMSGPGL
jgi:hypothetical protein